MFPVTRQVRRKRTPVFGRPGRTRGARMRRMGVRRAEEPAPGGRLGPKQAGSRQKQGGLGANVRSPDKQTHRWPPDGQAAYPGLRRLRGEETPALREPTMRSGRPRRRRRNAGADPLGHRSFMESA
jgi:hypothetical protein